MVYFKSMTRAVTLSADPNSSDFKHNFFEMLKKSPRQFRTIRDTSSFSKTSHNPSVAMIKYSSSGSIGFSIISGSAVTNG